MRDSISATLGALERDTGGVAIIWCPDLGLREWLVDEVASLVSSDQGAFRADSLEEALAKPAQLALWAPDDEKAAVLDLDASRDRLRDPERARTRTIALFLLRHGDGAEVLRSQAVSLWSIVAGSDVDPEELSKIDVDAERERFQAEMGKTPEEWLAEWDSGNVERTSQHFVTSYRAKLLEVPQ